VDRRGVKAAPFEYFAARSTTEAIRVLAADEGAKVIAGGQSLVPLMNLRLARPSVLVDINGIGYDRIEVDDRSVRIGALVRHRAIERSPALARAAPLLAEAAGLVGYPAIRHRGTIGGSIAHADPVAELPAALVALSGSVVALGPNGERVIAADEFFTGFLSTALAPDELLVELHVPVAGPGHGGAFCEWAPRTGDFAIAGAAVVVQRQDDGTIGAVHAAACGVATTPLDVAGALSAVLGERQATDRLVRSIALATAQFVGSVGTDEDRAELLGRLIARALHRAMVRSERVEAAA
jgi:carbon-monoxide dehydrogenase medium subunit